MTNVSSLPRGSEPSSGTGSGVLFLSRFFRYVASAASTVAECLREDPDFSTDFLAAFLTGFLAGDLVAVLRAGTSYLYPTRRGTPTLTSTPSEKCTTGSPSGAGRPAAVTRLSCSVRTLARRSGQRGWSARVYQSVPACPANNTNLAVR